MPHGVVVHFNVSFRPGSTANGDFGLGILSRCPTPPDGEQSAGLPHSLLSTSGVIRVCSYR